MPEFTLDRAQLQDKRTLAQAARDALDEVNEEIAKWNAMAATQRAVIADAVANLESKLSDIEMFVGSIAADNRDLFDSRTSKWQESNRGEDAASWLDEWEGFTTRTPPAPKIENLEEFECDGIEEFDELSNTAF